MRSFGNEHRPITKSPLPRAFCYGLEAGLRYGTIDTAVIIADLGSQQPHYGNDDQGNQEENNCVFNNTLSFFLRRE
jgi:hypothetical protein